jgi:hypothetical protein
MSLERLTQIAPPPAAPIETGCPKDWDQIQERLGTTLPTDYKKFIRCYGSGSFNNCLTVYNPFAKNESINLLEVLDAHHKATQRVQRLGSVSWSAVRPFSLFPAENGLIPWGTTDSFGDTFFWHASGPADAWSTLIYNLRTGEYEVWKYALIPFLVGLFTQVFESVVLSSDLSRKFRHVQFNLSRI